jgi:hypothetical protein
VTGVLLAALLAQSPAAPPAAPPMPVVQTEALAPDLALRVEVHRLRLELAQARVQLQEWALAREREALDAAVRAAHPGYALDWTTGHLVATVPVDTEPSERE